MGVGQHLCRTGKRTNRGGVDALAAAWCAKVFEDRASVARADWRILRHPAARPKPRQLIFKILRKLMFKMTTMSD
jgi:hypothetical protein